MSLKWLDYSQIGKAKDDLYNSCQPVVNKILITHHHAFCIYITSLTEMSVLFKTAISSESPCKTQCFGFQFSKLNIFLSTQQVPLTSVV